MGNSLAPVAVNEASQLISVNAMGRTFYDYREDFFSCLGLEDPLCRVDFKDAKIIGSLCEDGTHAPVLDIDFPARLLASPDGKQTLVFDIKIAADEARALMDEAKELGISGRGDGSWMVLDCPAILVPSETLGHFHLYLEVKLSWPQYEMFLTVLCRAGIIERGFYDVCMRNKKSTVTLPWAERKKVLPAGY